MIAFVLNLPYTLIGLIVAIASGPKRLHFTAQPPALVVSVHTLWWAIGYMRNARAATIGHVVLLGPDIERGDLEHELVHVEQGMRAPFVHPILYQIELLRCGYRNNRYEREAYERAGNIYKS